MSNDRSGFTLIELLVVISIIGLLSSIVIATLKAVRLRAIDTARIAEMRQMQTALELYYDTYGYYPRMTALTPQPGSPCGALSHTSQPAAGSGEANSWCNLMEKLSPFFPGMAEEEKDRIYLIVYDSSHGNGYQTYGMWLRLFSPSMKSHAETDGGRAGRSDYIDPFTGEATEAYLYEVGHEPVYCANKYTGLQRIFEVHPSDWTTFNGRVCNGGN